MKAEYTMHVNLKGLPIVHKINGNFFEQDSGGNRIRVIVEDDGNPLEITGSILANVVRADNETITVNGTQEGRIICIDLPEEAYAVIGKIQIFVKLKDGDNVTTLAAVEGKVYSTITKEVIANGNV